VRALSIRQPWIDMIIQGAKTLEVRSWELREPGTLALHSTIEVDHAAAYLFGYHAPWTLERGKILGIAQVSEVIELKPGQGLDLVAEHRQPLPIGEAMFGFRLTRVRALRRPFRISGKPFPFSLSRRAVERLAREFPDQFGACDV